MASSAGKLGGKVAIVTGGSGGIGLEVARNFAANGASVAITYQGNKAKAQDAVGKIEAAGGKAIAVKVDVSVAADVTALFDETVKAFGAVHVVAHCAGILLDTYPPVLHTSEEQWDQIYATNTKGTFLVSKEAAKRLGPGGRIINTTSSLVMMILPGYAAYQSSKAAVEVFSKTLAKELKGRKITVNVVSPGPIATEMFFQGKTQALIDSMIAQNPMGRLGEPKDIAAVFEFLASDASEWVNGQVIRANGGTIG